MSDDASPRSVPRVAVWRNAWLSGSETFIRDQVAAMRTWAPVRVGLRRVPGSLTPADLTLLDESRRSELRVEALGSLGLRRQAENFIAARHARLVHAHFGPDAITALPVAAGLHLPLVVTCHGYDVTRLPGLPGGVGRLYRRRLRHAFAHAVALIAVSRFIAERMIELGAPAERVRVLPIGIDTLGKRLDDPAPDPTQRRGVTFVGRLVPKKGVLDLLTAWARLPLDLRTKHPLRIVGDGPLADELRRQARRVEGPVELLGFRTSGEVARILERSAVYAQPSQTAADGDAEGFGMVFLEAGLQGVPVLAYAHGGVTDAVQDGRTGLLAREGDLDDLTSGLQRLLTDDALARRLGATARDRVLTDFDITTCTAALERVYDQAAGASR